jgi:hypothetical protein
LDQDPDTDPGKNHTELGSGQLRIRSEFEVKLLWKIINLTIFQQKCSI